MGRRLHKRELAALPQAKGLYSLLLATAPLAVGGKGYADARESMGTKPRSMAERARKRRASMLMRERLNPPQPARETASDIYTEIPNGVLRL